MAKRRAVTERGQTPQHRGQPADTPPLRSSDPPAASPASPRAVPDAPQATRQPRRGLQEWSVALLAALVVYVTCWPVDSVSLEQGEGLYACALAIAAGWLAWLARPAIGRGEPWAIDAVAWGLALWVVISIWGTDWQTNRRMAINEAWLWVAGAATLTAARRCCAAGATRRAMISLLVATSVGLAVHGWHQQLLSLPRTRAAYEADPEGQLAELGLQAPPGSAARMMFENRLYDGGPTATFSLANSLAGPLLLGCLLAGGVLLVRWRHSDSLRRIPWIAAALLTASMLGATHSRSAVAAALLGAAALALWRWLERLQKSPAGPPKSRGRIVAATLGAAGLAAVAAGAFLISDRELTERAPASVAFRLQYWRSTLAMVADSPWFGCGPGNFQARYERYREASASEQIAEPHNFLMETLAAGGLPAAGLLATLIVLIANEWRTTLSQRRHRALATDQGPSADAGLLGARGVIVGAAVAVAAIWLIGFAVRRVPDLEAHLLAVPAAAMVLVGLRRWTSGGQFPLPVGIVAVAALAVHLLAAGGWTVPGIAVPLWILCGSLLPAGRGGGQEELVPNRSAVVTGATATRWMIAVVGLLLLTALYGWGIRPAAAANRSLELARYYSSVGRLRDAEQALLEATAADRWDPQPPLELAGLYLQGLLQVAPTMPEHDALRSRWMAAVGEAQRRSPEAPAMRAALGEHSLWLYQRWGQPEDLQRALRQYDEAARMAPASERLAAQLAVVLAAAKRPEEALRWADRAETLSAAGGHIERQLQLAPLLVARVVGGAAETAPATASAAQLLANLRAAPDVPVQ